MTVEVRFEGVSRHFGEVRAVDQLSFEISDGEFFSLLGPSGSGKTTCLRLIAGFEVPDTGRIEIHGRDAGDLPPYERDVNTVFQDYALFPHLSVLDNVAYALMVRKIPKTARYRRAGQMLDLVALSGLGGRKPAELSGGQRQRVALARALINQPSVLLLDEPLGALDLKLREQMQVELKALQRQVGVTFVYVTHDQQEALSMSDRLAVFSEGRIEQIGTPQEIYERPATAFVAGFVGTSNVVDAGSLSGLPRGTGRYSLRPEKITLLSPDEAPPSGKVTVLGRVAAIQYLGANTRIDLAMEDGTKLIAIQGNGAVTGVPLDVGTRLRAFWDPAAMHPIAGFTGAEA